MSRRGRESWRLVGDAERTGVVGGGCRGLGRGAALLHAGRHLRHGVAPDAGAAPCRGIRVVLHHRGQHGDVVALGADHGVLGNRGVARFGGQGVLETLFCKTRQRKNNFIRTSLTFMQLVPCNSTSTPHVTLNIPNRQEEQCKPEDPSLEYKP